MVQLGCLAVGIKLITVVPGTYYTLYLFFISCFLHFFSLAPVIKYKMAQSQQGEISSRIVDAAGALVRGREAILLSSRLREITWK